MKNNTNIANNRFELLLKSRKINYLPEDKIDKEIPNISTKPDFLLYTKHGNILVEIKSLERDSPLGMNRNRITNVNVGVVDPEIYMKRLKGMVKEAADQFRPYKDLKIPCVVVLDNWKHIFIPMGRDELFQIFGNYEFRINYDPKLNITVGDAILYHGKNRRLNEKQHTYISAIAFAKENSHGNTCLLLAHNPFATAPLQEDVFSDKDDEQYKYENGCWGIIQPK